jgi:hypothetical protein
MHGMKYVDMTHVTNSPTPKLRKASQPPLSYPGAATDSDRAKKPRLAEPAATDQELNPGDRVEGLGDFGGVGRNGCSRFHRGRGREFA